MYTTEKQSSIVLKQAANFFKSRINQFALSESPEGALLFTKQKQSFLAIGIRTDIKAIAQDYQDITYSKLLANIAKL